MSPSGAKAGARRGQRGQGAPPPATDRAPGVRGGPKGRTKEEQVAAFLREGIIAGRFARGQKLKQAEIAAQLQLSITPVREALKLLAAEGYLLGASHRGAVVAPFDHSAAQEIVDLRALLEGRLLLAAMRRFCDGDLRALLALQTELEQRVAQQDAGAVRALNHRFHQRLYTPAERPQTLRFVNVLWSRYPFDLINGVEGRIGRTACEHGEILHAVAAGDEGGALVALRRHILAGWEELQAVLPAEPLRAAAGHPAGGAGSAA